jgi:hypothetical protein|tara:strand:- start:133 stop:330 length:198 start_codon:yes stop_codon:yes gene_type:complete
LKFKNIFYSFIASLIIVGHFSISNAFAYIDPSSGTLIIQMLAGALIGGGIAIKVYWEKIKMKFLK